MKIKKNGFLIVIFLLQGVINLSFTDKDDFFSIIILPDTQYYSTSFPEMFYKQMNWIVENKKTLNIQYVIQLGDLTDNNKEYAWEVASKSFKILENAGVPYSIVYGDNDMMNPEKNTYDGIRHTELLNRYFPDSRFDKTDSWWSGGFFESGKIDNYYSFFNYGEYKFLIMNLEIAPRSAVLNWADDIVAQNPSRKVIVVTHDYIDKDGNRLDDLKSFGLEGRDKANKLKGNNANEVFDKLIRKNPNIMMVLCGHKNGEFQKEVEIKKSKNSGRSRVLYEILSDYQDEKAKGSNERSGNGLLRMLKYYPEKNEISLTTISALTGESKAVEVRLYPGK
jgi:hypothetical protein